MSRPLQLQRLQLQPLRAWAPRSRCTVLARAVRAGAVAPAAGASPRGLVVPARGVRVVARRCQLMWQW
jgi:hypothetical protein